MKRMSWVGRSAAAVVAAGALVACGGGDSDDDGGGDGGAATVDATVDAGSAPAAPAGGSDHDLWEGELESGNRLRVRLRVSADDPAVAPFEAFRQTVGGPDVGWVVGEITVPAEVTDGAGRYVTFVSEGADAMTDDPADANDGVTSATFACSVIQEWLGAEPDPDWFTAYEELFAGPCQSNPYAVPAASGTTTTYVMVHHIPLPDFERIFAGLAYELSPA